MIIAFEGLSCAGKSAVSSELHLRHPEFNLVTEFLIKETPPITTEMCMANDIAKYNYAQILSDSGKIVLVDRSYLSTLVYTYAEGNKKYERTLNWYQNAFEKGLIRDADMYFYLRMQANKSIDRATSVNRLNKKYAWYNNVMVAYQKYENIFDERDLKKSCHKIDVDNLEFTKLISQVEDIINQL